MKAKYLTIALLSLSTISASYAYNYPSGSSASYGSESSASYGSESTASYASESTASYANQPGEQPESFQWKFGKDVSVSVNIPGTERRQRPQRKPRMQIDWVNVKAGDPLPDTAVVGGGEANNPELFVCRANYNRGLHPGKVVGSSCNISWGGREITLNNYQVLVSTYPLNWVRSAYGSVPNDAIPGGYENGKRLYICQATYAGGIHPGKLVSKNCNIAWGGREISVSNYNVLVG